MKSKITIIGSMLLCGILSGCGNKSDSTKPAEVTNPYIISITFESCKQWLGSKVNTAELKYTIKNESKVPIRLVGKLVFRNASDQLLRDENLYSNDSLMPGADKLMTAYLGEHSCAEIERVAIGSVESISKINEQKVTPEQLQQLQKGVQVNFDKKKFAADAPPKAPNDYADSDVVHTNAQGVIFLMPNEVNCNKIKGMTSEMAEVTARNLQITFDSIKFIRAKMDGNTCRLVVDTAKGIHNCLVGSVAKSDSGSWIASGYRKNSDGTAISVSGACSNF